MIRFGNNVHLRGVPTTTGLANQVVGSDQAKVRSDECSGKNLRITIVDGFEKSLRELAGD